MNLWSIGINRSKTNHPRKENTLFNLSILDEIKSKLNMYIQNVMEHESSNYVRYHITDEQTINWRILDGTIESRYYLIQNFHNDKPYIISKLCQSILDYINMCGHTEYTKFLYNIYIYLDKLYDESLEYRNK